MVYFKVEKPLQEVCELEVRQLTYVIVGDLKELGHNMLYPIETFYPVPATAHMRR
jgi:hypothetical protein